MLHYLGNVCRPFVPHDTVVMSLFLSNSMSSHREPQASHSGKRKCHEKQDLVHPYILKFNARQEK